MPARATAVVFSNGCTKARQPLRAGGKDLWRVSTVMALGSTAKLITCLSTENNRTTSEKREAHGECRQSPVEYYRWGFPPAHAGKVASAGFRRGAACMVTQLERANVPAHVLVRFLDRECVLLNLDTERYFGLDETGTRMWQLITTASNMDAAVQALLA